MVPKKDTGSYGTNGVYLQFQQTGTSANASGIGADTSGNGNHFAVSNLAATDIGIDTPQNNYCTINSVYADDGNNMIGADFTEGNRKQLTTVDGWKFGRGTFLLEAGKWYVEVKATEAGSGENGRFGLQPSQGGEALGNTDDNDTFEGINVGFDGSNTNLQKLYFHCHYKHCIQISFYIFLFFYFLVFATALPYPYLFLFLCIDYWWCWIYSTPLDCPYSNSNRLEYSHT